MKRNAKGAFIRFCLAGREWVYQGEWPRKLDGTLRSAIERLQYRPRDLSIYSEDPEDMLPGILEIIREMGGEVLEVHTVRKDGSMRPEDLPEFYVYT
mgnify:CR=1 FL=1